MNRFALVGMILAAALSLSTMAQAAEDITRISIDGNQKMIFGPTTDKAYSNTYSLKLWSADGTPVSEAELNAAGGFKVQWDIVGFQTENDQPGQYCDSYGSFATNGAASLSTSFELRNVPMNFYGVLTAVLSIGDKTYNAEKGVVALGNERVPDTQVLPLGGYPAAFDGYPDKLVGKQVLAETYGQAQDAMFGRWIVAGSDESRKAELCLDEDGSKYMRFSAEESGKTHVFAKSFTPPTSLMVFSTKVRFHNPGTTLSLTTRFPFKHNVKLYTNPVTMLFDGSSLTLNDIPLSRRGKPSKIKTDRWYIISLQIDKRNETCQATISDAKGRVIGQSAEIGWKETSRPDFFSIGFTEEATGTVDIASCEAIAPNAAAERYNVDVEKGNIYRVEVTYQGILSTGYVNSDLAGYTLGMHEQMKTDTLLIACPRDVLDLRIAAGPGGEAKIQEVNAVKMPKPEQRDKPKVHHIGDSTSASTGSWAWYLERMYLTDFPELAAICDFSNKGAGGRNLGTYYQQGRLAAVLLDICPGDILILGNNGTNGMNSTFEEDINYYLDAAEAMGARVILNSYTPHGVVGARYMGGYDPQTCRFDSYRRDAYDVILRKVAAQRIQNDPMCLGFIEIGQNADAIFNAYVADYKANGYESESAAAQAVMHCFRDHNHYDRDPLACMLMLKGYSTSSVPGIVQQIIELIK